MIRNALTGEPKPVPKSEAPQETDLTAEGSPPPGHVSGTAGPARVEPAQLAAPGASIEDCDCLLAAVTARLRRAAHDASPHFHNGGGSLLQASVLECADALDQIRATLQRARGVKAPEGARDASAQP